MSSIRRLLEVSAERKISISQNQYRLWAGFDLSKEPNKQRHYMMSLKVGQRFRASDDDMFHIVPLVETAIVHGLFGCALSLIANLESALHMGDRLSAFEILGELKKEMML